ncbi:MAG: PHP domain-containing protein [Clostridia bacterium]|nr:PHP domain-containing protein [Clostridia bacterium]
MFLTADYHTHTKYSDGKNTVLENVSRAKELGLKEIGITEHGYSHLFFGLHRRETKQFIKEIREAEEITGVRTLIGMESNIRGKSGLCDLKETDYENFDVYLAGIHVCIHYDKWRDMKLGWGSWLRASLNKKPSKKLIQYTTDTYINAIKNNPIDVITHLNFLCFANAVDVAKCCRDYGTYLEISSKKQHLTDEELAAVADTGVRFVINSDAHWTDRIGDLKLAEEQILRVGIPLDRIDNIDGKLPNFRFTEYKKRHM